MVLLSSAATHQSLLILLSVAALNLEGPIKANPL